MSLPIYITIKRAIKRCAGWAAVASQPLLVSAESRWACVFMYHRIAPIGFIDQRVDDWNVPPVRFAEQIAALADFAEFVSLAELFNRLHHEEPLARPLVALTFDDVYAHFTRYALPVLQRHSAPATVFAVTGTVGQCGPYAFDGWSQKHAPHVAVEMYRPVSWHELEECAATGLVTVGSHSHRHQPCATCSYEDLLDEAQQSRAILQQRLGSEHGNIYAYPYGSTRLGFVSPLYVEAVRQAGYQMAVTSDVGVISKDSNMYLLPRVEAHAVDARRALRAKALGVLGPYHAIDWLRRQKRAV